MPTLRDPQRLSYVNKDVTSVDEDIARYITAFIPSIKGVGQSNEGRLILRLLAGLIDMLNFSVDQTYGESNILTVKQLKNIIKQTKLTGYSKQDASGSQVDCRFYMLEGTAGAGGQSIPLWTQLQKSATPIVWFVTTESATIPEGESSISGVGAIQGYPVTGESLTTNASGDPDQEYILGSAKVVANQVRVYVGGETWELVDNFWDSTSIDKHFVLDFDEDHICTVKFGDDNFGKIPPSGSVITTDYIYTDGEGHDVGIGEIDKVVGAAGAFVGVANDAESSGGDDGDTVELIQKKAPSAFSTMWRGVTTDDILNLATSYPGIYSAKLENIMGTILKVYLLPDGGGETAQSKLDEVQDYLNERCVVQGRLVAESIKSARIRINAHVTAKTNKISKSVLLKHVWDELVAAFAYDQFDTGEGYTISQVGEIILSIQNNTLFKSVDFTVLSRWPRVVKSNDLAPDMDRDIEVTPLAGYDTWVVTALTTVDFSTTKNGYIEMTNGSVGVPYTPAGGEMTFTLGTTSDFLVPGDTWTFKTSKLVGNVLVDYNEHMSLNESDLEVTVYYPGEYNATS